MIYVAIVEDQEDAAKELSSYIKRVADGLDGLKFSDFSINVYGTSRAFLSDSASKSFDIVFMDIGLPDLDGMKTAEKMRQSNSSSIIVFVTDMAQFAIAGYKVDALDYIVKPVSYYNFSMVLQRALDKLERAGAQSLTVRTVGGITRLKPDEIRYVEVRDHEIIYHTGAGDVRAYGHLKDIEPKLESQGFIRCSRYYLVNLKYVRSIEDSTLDVDGIKLEISVRKKREVMLKVAEFFG